MLRGVVWRSGEVELWPLWRDMARCWPTALVDGDGAGSQLLAHAGVLKPQKTAEMQGLFAAGRRERAE